MSLELALRLARRLSDSTSLIRFRELERVTGDSFERVFASGTPLDFSGFNRWSTNLGLNSGSWLRTPEIFVEVVRRVRKMFDLDSDPVLIANCFAQVPFSQNFVIAFRA